MQSQLEFCSRCQQLATRILVPSLNNCQISACAICGTLYPINPPTLSSTEMPPTWQIAPPLAPSVAAIAPRGNFCFLCNQYCAGAVALQNHMRVHTGERPFQCPHCPSAFKRQAHLKMHMRTHTGEQPFQCPRCKRTFSHPGNLNRHIKEHSIEEHPIERSFQCHLCGKTFAFLCQRKKHLAKTHGINS